MAKAGYSEKFRKEVITHGINIYEKKVKESDEGGEPLNRGKDYKRIERVQQKKMKKKQWNKKGGYSAPIIVPATPHSELAKMLREVCNKETDKKLRFKIVEKGGDTVERRLVKPNPMGSDDCGKEDCVVCKQPGGGKMCHKCNINYHAKCEHKMCDSNNVKYLGESFRNMYSRGAEHERKRMKKDESSFMHRHDIETHPDDPPNWSFKVIKSFRDPLSRQVSEAIHIKNHEGILLNSKSEFFQPPLVKIRKEIVRGLEA